MRVRIVEGRVAELDPVLGEAECAMIVDAAPEVQVGWLWSPEGCTAPPEAVEPGPDPVTVARFTLTGQEYSPDMAREVIYAAAKNRPEFAGAEDC